MALPAQLPLVDRLIPGGLETFLAEARAKGESYVTIARRLDAEHDITTTHQTVANWCKHYGIEKVAAS